MINLRYAIVRGKIDEFIFEYEGEVGNLNAFT